MFATSLNWEGVRGESHGPAGGGVSGVALNPQGTGAGVYGESQGKGAGLWGVSAQAEGVHAETNGTGFAAVAAFMKNPNGTGAGVYANNNGKGHGVFATSLNWEGVHGESHGLEGGGVSGVALNPQGTGAGVYGESQGKGAAGFFKGNVVVTGDLVVTGDVLLQGADYAEEFDLQAETVAHPGTVMVIDEVGSLCPSSRAYDRRVAGIVSGAGPYRTAITLDRQNDPQRPRCAIALMGKVACLADATHGPIGIGDLLTTSPTPGHAMRTDDPARAFGTVIGKALTSLPTGKGMVSVLIALQ